MKRVLSAYHLVFARSLVFMLQASEYSVTDYLEWFWRTRDFRLVATRGTLDMTVKASLLVAVAWLTIGLELTGALFLVVTAGSSRPLIWLVAVILALLTPLSVAYVLAGIVWVGEVLIQRPRQRVIIASATAKLTAHPGLKIAVAGSYGKTTMKEILLSVLSAGKKVAATPGNMNTPLGISRFIQSLSGDEEILIFELGEYYPGDIAALCQMVKPTMGILTGINEAHLSKFKSLELTTATIFELVDYLTDLPTYKNGENQLILGRADTSDPLLYSKTGVNGWSVGQIKIDHTATSFLATRENVQIQVRSGLLGSHEIGPLVAALDIASRVGLSPSQIRDGLALTAPFDHRMQPRKVAGAWIIDDTYNGNRDGILAGLAWLAAVPAKRRIYVTPGLVELGDQTQAIHEAIGSRIGAVADVVVLMKNSTTNYIVTGLKAAGFTGDLTIVDDPLRFYTNVDQFVAVGDVMLMQNDWTDNYN
jgi:UDP-N-acetylmuramoyl-tripeptide--D-alanyl-D-alanine ligase